MTEKWKSSDATEPSSLYTFSTRIGGVVCLVIAAYATYVLFV
ncbi:DUF6199 family natural product biosynthesis protein [Paenibacillus sp. ACRSA]